MTATSNTMQVAQAFNRFGLGGGLTDAIPADPVAWLNTQLQGSDPLANSGISSTYGLYLGNNVLTATTVTARAAAMTSLRNFFSQEQRNFIANALTTQTPFRERLVWFWTNHFAILAGGPVTTGTAGAFVREAIRPHVTGTYTDMLLAVMQHPAMLVSLNNDVSVGPQSPYAQAQQKGGINENLARETLELFSVGLASNFAQADVDALAYILTGWTVSLTGSTAGFIIASDQHQPGAQTLLGVTYPGTVFDGYQALSALATHPATYQLLATKLVTHFVADAPDPADIAVVVRALSQSGGNLAAAAAALIGLANAWVPQTKLRTPLDFVVAAARAAGTPVTYAAHLAADVAALDQPLWQPPFPNGWPDTAGRWASPAQMMQRTNWANAFSSNYRLTDPAAVTNAALGGLLSTSTASVLARLSSTHDKLTLLFCSPDFQRR